MLHESGYHPCATNLIFCFCFWQFLNLNLDLNLKISKFLKKKKFCVSLGHHVIPLWFMRIMQGLVDAMDIF